jgi:hypothetical protein
MSPARASHPGRLGNESTSVALFLWRKRRFSARISSSDVTRTSTSPAGGMGPDRPESDRAAPPRFPDVPARVGSEPITRRAFARNLASACWLTPVTCLLTITNRFCCKGRGRSSIVAVYNRLAAAPPKRTGKRMPFTPPSATAALVGNPAPYTCKVDSTLCAQLWSRFPRHRRLASRWSNVPREEKEAGLRFGS